MTAIHETAYPRLRPDIGEKELKEAYTPTESELTFVSSQSTSRIKQLGLLILLKLCQRVGYFPKTGDVPDIIVDHIVLNAGFARPLTVQERVSTDAASMRYSNIAALRIHLVIQPLESEKRDWLEGIARKGAEVKHIIPDIINVLLEELVRHRYELPPFPTLDRIAKSAREFVNDRYFDTLVTQLSDTAKSTIDDLLKSDAGNATTDWNVLKREPAQPTQKEVREYLQHVRRLQSLALMLPAINIPAPKLKHFRSWARSLDAGELAELKPQKRYALATIFIRAQQAKTLDDVADVFIRLMQNLDNNAQKKLLEHQQQHLKTTDALIGQLREVLLAYQIEGNATRKINAIEGSLLTDVAQLVAQCEQYLAFAGRNYLPFMLQPYQFVRGQLFNCVQLMELRSTSEDRDIERMCAVLLSLRGVRQEILNPSDIGIDVRSDLVWMSPSWKKLALIKAEGRGSPTRINRKYFEIAVLQQIKQELKNGDLFIEQGERYDDYREELVDIDELKKELAEYGEVTGVEVDGATFVSKLRDELTTLAKQVDEAFPANDHAEIVEGRLILNKLKKPMRAPEVQKLDLIIRDRMPQLSILDVLTDTERWLDLHRLFKPFPGTESRLSDPRGRFITALFCYGCNLGPSQTARSLRDLNRRQVSWLNVKYVTEESLERAITEVINSYAKFDLPHYWGSGNSVSVDGTKWDLYEESLFSEYHIRYGGYGGIGYYHVSDMYIALYSRFISCGVYEATYMLDALMANESDIKPDTVHGDTHSQNLAVFALAHLLGIKLMPRIRRIKDLIFYRPATGAKYKNIDSLFGEAIDWKMIETHLPDMLRVVVSIKLGKITASTVLRRLGTYSRKNKLYFAFRELGKVIRTNFLLKFIADATLRNTISAATNKSEEFNSFIKWVFFGGEGIIAENVQHEQRKVVKYSHLAANMVMLHNVHWMTKIIQDLQKEGMTITPAMVAGLAPFRHGHINRFGDYALNWDRDIGLLGVDSPIIL